ncbi:lysophospholipid acyltransferase family protein [Mycolicibacterium parafortuitum]|uniref:Putative acyltransferase [Amycolicicoccus subflavus DQS3-9A1] n=1 Tax=Mycolicibacterium parafortuitum TaxID=39692 RepID=A0A375YQ97_MYCPF|nr:lysophospholipid acyltransferase family protein [Mycolicibacterium parafortuitum]ORB28263.1 glycerol acyltransferase [Mycolicibacterium parafortuitum]SRX83270.1 putative acyltransferase [Amycolicicoccus subflavus DQS3-9A1] [Mycolicibacterium parafortuitum]
MPSTPIPDSADRSLGERLWRTALTTVADHFEPVMNLYKPYVEGVEHLPADGRFLIVGNHTQMSAAEIVLIPYCVRQAIGSQVRPLADRQFGKMRGLQADLIAAYGAVVGSPESAATLMRENATILVFPGGGREIGKFKGEEYKLRWDNRYGFARLAAEHRYPIVTAALVGGDDVYTSITTRDSLYGRASSWLGERLGGRSDMAMPLVRGIGPTLIPQPQRMYLRFGAPISSAEPTGTPRDTWVSELKEKVQTQLESDLEDLQRVRRDDPYRALNPLARHHAATPHA